MASRNILVNGSLKTVKSDADIDTVIARLKTEGKDVKRCNATPSLKTLEKYSNDGIAKATDGCRVEPDGTCQHGHKSWLLQLGYI